MGSLPHTIRTPTASLSGSSPRPTRIRRGACTASSSGYPRAPRAFAPSGCCIRPPADASQTSVRASGTTRAPLGSSPASSMERCVARHPRASSLARRVCSAVGVTILERIMRPSTRTAVSSSSPTGTQIATLLQEAPRSSHKRDLLLQRLASSVELTEVDPGCHAVTTAVPTIPVYSSRCRGRRRIDERSDLPAGHAVDAQGDPVGGPRRLVANRCPTTEWTWRG